MDKILKDGCECCKLLCEPQEGENANPLLDYLGKAAAAAGRLGYFAADVRAIARDPAIRANPLALAEIILYASFWALALHRVAHFLRALGIPFVPRLLSQVARFATGIEIHPGATIGPGLFVDHGMGVVIGETAIVGANVLVYHGVTLGGVDSRPCRRHPLVEDGAVIGAGAKVLGPVTIGEGAKIGAQSVVLANVPPGATAVGIPARIVRTPTGETRIPARASSGGDV
jgi:serine O-acetyltransferase